MSTTNGMIGRPVKRVEDKRFITGKGRYTDDIILPGQTYASFVRSPYAHAKIISVNVDEAKSMAGVIAIHTGADVAEVNGVPCGWLVNFKNGNPMKEPKHPLLVTDKARYTGDPVAIVIAETREQAIDAAEAVMVEYEELPVVVNAAEAVKP
jgi:carbon-monoxide dehydrogenase large subunit